MDGTRFDRITKGLTVTSSRRRLLAGLGAISTGALAARGVAAAPSPRAVCMRECNRAAKDSRRELCAGLKGREKRDCLKGVKEERALCHEGCRA